MSRNIKLLGVVAAVALVLGGVSVLGRFAGEASGRSALERLQLVWPDYMSMPEADRAVIAGLAFQCGMDRVEKRAEAVVACLQEAAASDEPAFPKGVVPEAGRRRLAELIARGAGRAE